MRGGDSEGVCGVGRWEGEGRRAEQSTHSETFMFFHYNRIFSLSPGTAMNFCFLVKLKVHACFILCLRRSVYALLYDSVMFCMYSFISSVF